MIAQKLSSTQTHSLPRAEVLNAIRRLDWRFLLPDPSLGRVVYLGAAESSLLEALRVAGLSVAVVTGEAAQSGRASFDTAVAVAPSPGDLALAATLLRPGGWLYAEVSGSSGAARRTATLLRRNGFGAIQRHWHWPDFARCTRILPLDDAGALVYGLGKGRGRPAVLMVRGLAASGILPWLARSISLVAQRGHS